MDCNCGSNTATSSTTGYYPCYVKPCCYKSKCDGCFYRSTCVNADKEYPIYTPTWIYSTSPTSVTYNITYKTE